MRSTSAPRVNPSHEEPERDDIRSIVDRLYRDESRAIFATLVRVVGDFDLAEEAMHEAFAVAVEKWENEGVPDKPFAWIVSTARFKAIDAIRRTARFDSGLDGAITPVVEPLRPGDLDETDFADDQLRLIFTCCHPALPPAVQVAMTLRELCGLTTEEVASAFLVPPSTVAQRIVRGKAKIRDARIPYKVPAPEDLPERLESVLTVIYLVFNEGYSTSTGASATREDLSSEAIRLGRILLDLLPDPEVMGLLGLMLLHESRRAARTDENGDLILLEDQNRSRWNRAMAGEGTRLATLALASGDFGVYTIQAAISATHANAPSAASTDWGAIVGFYDLLLSAEPSPVAELNRAVAVAMRDDPQSGLDLIDAILARGELRNYHLAHAARADLCRRIGRNREARESYERALELSTQEPERRFLERRIRELG